MGLEINKDDVDKVVHDPTGLEYKTEDLQYLDQQQMLQATEEIPSEGKKRWNHFHYWNQVYVLAFYQTQTVSKK